MVSIYVNFQHGDVLDDLKKDLVYMNLARMKYHNELNHCINQFVPLWSIFQFYMAYPPLFFLETQKLSFFRFQI